MKLGPFYLLREATIEEWSRVRDVAEKKADRLEQLERVASMVGLRPVGATRPSYVLAHVAPTLPARRLALAEVRADERDVALAERLIAAFSAARADEGRLERRHGGGLWEEIALERHATARALLDARDARGLAAILAGGFRHEMTTGVACDPAIYADAQTEEGAACLAALAVDRMVSLGEALGVLPLENPEYGRFESLQADLDALAPRIEHALGFPIAMPSVAGVYGVRVGASIFFDRHFDHMYAAWRIRDLLAGSPGSVAEIGGGFGGVAYYARRAGVRDYEIFDLPFMNVFQGYFLMKTLGEDAVALHGEPGGAGRVRVSPYWAFDGAVDGQFALCLNQDSFPELSREVIVGYLETARRVVRGPLLSINQETLRFAAPAGGPALSFSQLAVASGLVRRLQRTPYWMRRGYVEELYAFTR